MNLNGFKKDELAKIADDSGTSIEYLFQIRNGKRRPSPELALKIEQATNGAVTRMELLYPKKDQAQEA